MSKVNIAPTNDFCPQTLFLYGTYDDEGKPDFGLFCWFSYLSDDGHLGVMACIGGEKLTKDNIHKRKVFSANLVTEKLLPLADYMGTVDGRANPDKMNVDIAIDKGSVLPVPILKDSPVTYELEVKQFIPLKGAEVILCGIRNVIMDEELTKDSASLEEKLAAIAPVSTTAVTYFDWTGKALGGWGKVKEQFSCGKQ